MCNLNLIYKSCLKDSKSSADWLRQNCINHMLSSFITEQSRNDEAAAEDHVYVCSVLHYDHGDLLHHQSSVLTAWAL